MKLLTLQEALYSIKITAVLRGFYIDALWQNFYLAPILLTRKRMNKKEYLQCIMLDLWCHLMLFSPCTTYTYFADSDRKRQD